MNAELLGTSFDFATAPGLFSADRVDDGTRLLLDHLPAGTPGRVLDLGCGYGALGLPIAARHRDAQVMLVDRDTLAVELSRRNAEKHQLGNVSARPSLGYRDVGDEHFDWVLCNVPARIGDAAIEYILVEGARRLAPGGELRVVVIRDLGPVVERISARLGGAVKREAEGARHIVYALGPMAPAEAGGATDHESLYARDRVRIEEREFTRPHDISEDPDHQRNGLPLLLELLPRAPKGKALVWRGGYGVVPVTLVQRGAEVLAVDRDLLATTFTRRNAAAHGVPVQTRDAFSLATALAPEEQFAFVLGEANPTSGDAANAEDWIRSVEALRPGGMALWLGLTKPGRAALEKLAKKKKLAFAAIASRGAYTVWRLSRAAR